MATADAKLRRSPELSGPLVAPESMRDSEILVVDDEAINVALLERLLERAGYRRVCTLTDSRSTLDHVNARTPDLLLLDLHMPHLDGFAVMEQLASWLTGPRRFPVVVLTADITPEAKLRALAAGARDFVTKPFDVSEVLVRIANLLDAGRMQRQLVEQNELLEHRVRERTRELEGARFDVVERLGLAAEYRDDNTHEHTRRVGQSAAQLAATLGRPEREVEVLRLAAPLHDIGKIGVPDAILLKPGPLTPSEFEAMKRHATIGAQILLGGASDLLRMAEVVARCHHERWDGTGYPNGLAGEAIPLVARIVTVCDVFDALLHERPHKPAWSLERALAEIERGAGGHFDPDVARAFVGLVRDGAGPMD